MIVNHILRSCGLEPSVNKKYKKTGGIDRNKSYYHRGNNNWVKYSKAMDASHTLKKPKDVAKRGSKKFDNRNSHKGDTRGKRHGREQL